MPSTTPAPTCHHIFADRHRCGSPALRGERFCYFHLPAPRNHHELQQALGEVITRVAANKLDVHRAGLLLYSLQMASRNL